MLKDIDFYHSQENIKTQLLHTRPYAVKMASKNVAHKASEFIVNKIVDVVSESNCDKIVKH